MARVPGPVDNPCDIDPALAVTDSEQLLLKWYQQWTDRDDMPPKMHDGLHMQTLLYFTDKEYQNKINRIGEMMPQ